jgi:hypothetical protein
MEAEKRVKWNPDFFYDAGEIRILLFSCPISQMLRNAWAGSNYTFLLGSRRVKKFTGTALMIRV